MSVYLLSIPALISRSPLFMAGFVALLGTAAVGLAYLLGREWLSRGAALCAAWLFAVSPWAVLFSRKIWAQDLLPVFAILFFLCMVRWTRRARWGWILGAAISFAILCQIHYSALALFPIIPAVLIWKRSRLALKQFAVGAAIFLALWTPFLIVLPRGEAFASGQYRRPENRFVNYPGQLMQAFLWEGRLAAYGELNEIVLGRRDGGRGWPADVGFGLFVAICVGAAAWRARTRRDFWLLPAWLLLPPLLLSLNRMHFHYMVICYPALFLALGVLLDEVHARLRGRTARTAFILIAAAATALVAADETAFTVRLDRTLAAQGGAPGDYGITYRDKLNVARLLVKEVPEGRYALVDYTHPTTSEEAYEYLYHLNGGEAVRVAPGEGAPVYVLFGPGVEGRMRSGTLRDLGEIQLGPLRAQKLLPINPGSGQGAGDG
jgi:hypothetical protein